MALHALRLYPVLFPETEFYDSFDEFRPYFFVLSSRIYRRCEISFMISNRDLSQHEKARETKYPFFFHITPVIKDLFCNILHHKGVVDLHKSAGEFTLDASNRRKNQYAEAYSSIILSFFI